jgi:hypothetical protein
MRLEATGFSLVAFLLKADLASEFVDSKRRACVAARSLKSREQTLSISRRSEQVRGFEQTTKFGGRDHRNVLAAAPLYDDRFPIHVHLL